MCNTDHDPNKGKEKVNEEPIVTFKTIGIQNNENKRKAIVLVESETNNLKSPTNADAGEESSNSSKEISPFLLFGFIIDPNKRIRHGYSCNFCSRKFINPQALGGHQNCHKLERRLKKRAEDINKNWINYLNGTQRMVSQNTIIPYHGGYGYPYNGYDNMIQLSASSNFHAGNLLEVINEADQGIMNPQITMPGGADGDNQEDKDNQEEEESKIDLTLKL
ncbi:zinc finger protein 2-like [Trifolium pratense]|uniref:zinc finger protein 2-like n=1 Tax=Trifolium pratense TaxID=57577 RepID=UPI001E692AC2|nr:zinc finger protein 2-like [Trifolium pratense]